MQTDVLIIGCGMAGAVAALTLAEDKQRQITVITRAKNPTESNTYYAQGGIIGGFNKNDPEELIEDILNAGAGISHLPAVELLAKEGPILLQKILIDNAQVPFDRDENGELNYALEGAHSNPRILHVADMTGRAIMNSMHKKLAKKPNIQILTEHTAIDLITFPHHSTDPCQVYEDPICLGAYVFDQTNKEVLQITAGSTILATGGLGQIFLNTSNPAGSRGDGLAMASRAGVRIINSEYIQFHPTSFSKLGSANFLISEAVRGEGAVLLTPEGGAFMELYAPKWKDLAPRDVVARAIYIEMLNNDYPHAYLDLATYKKPNEIRQRFPQIYQHCLNEGVDITKEPIPVVPAAHYFCGGLQVDLNGRTSLNGLFAIGEVSCTGIHGANRLASSSLLECLVWGYRAAQDIRKNGIGQTGDRSEIPEWSSAGMRYDPDPALIHGDMQTIKNLMWHYVGLIRNGYRINRAVRDLRYLRWEIESFYRKTRLSDDLIGLRNMIQSASVITFAASRNRKSRGSHYREDSI